jgi:hypothetical protein
MVDIGSPAGSFSLTIAEALVHGSGKIREARDVTAEILASPSDARGRRAAAPPCRRAAVPPCRRAAARARR